MHLYANVILHKFTFKLSANIYLQCPLKSELYSYEAEIIFNDLIIDQYLYRIFSTSSYHFALYSPFDLKDANLFFFSTLSRPTAESAVGVVNLSLWFNYTGKYYRTDGVN